MRDPDLVVGDGAMGLWKALREVFPAARHQRCWVKSAQPGATKAMQGRSTTPRTGPEGTPVLTAVTSDGTTETDSPIDEIVREGARLMTAAALEAEVNHCTAELTAERDEGGRRLVIRNGHHRPRTVTTCGGTGRGQRRRVA